MQYPGITVFFNRRRKNFFDNEKTRNIWSMPAGRKRTLSGRWSEWVGTSDWVGTSRLSRWKTDWVGIYRLSRYKSTQSGFLNSWKIVGTRKKKWYEWAHKESSNFEKKNYFSGQDFFQHASGPRTQSELPDSVGIPNYSNHRPFYNSRASYRSFTTSTRAGKKTN